MSNMYNIEKLMSVSNPMLVAAMGLVAKENSKANNKIFIEELKRAVLLVQLYVTPPPVMDENGRPKLSQESKMSMPAFNVSGKRFLGVYTDLGEIRKIKTEGEPIIMPYGLKQLTLVLSQKDSVYDGILINPGSNGMVITAPMLLSIVDYIGKAEAVEKGPEA